jgi:hypothetical protein
MSLAPAIFLGALCIVIVALILARLAGSPRDVRTPENPHIHKAEDKDAFQLPNGEHLD